MAIESSFNPFAQSSVGAQGLMQVMTKVHDDKYEAFGGNLAAFDPVTNLRVGVQVLKECIARAGSLEAGLRFYVGAANLPDDGGYAGQGAGRAAALAPGGERQVGAAERDARSPSSPDADAGRSPRRPRRDERRRTAKVGAAGSPDARRRSATLAAPRNWRCGPGLGPEVVNHREARSAPGAAGPDSAVRLGSPAAACSRRSRRAGDFC